MSTFTCFKTELILVTINGLIQHFFFFYISFLKWKVYLSLFPLLQITNKTCLSRLGWGSNPNSGSDGCFYHYAILLAQQNLFLITYKFCYVDYVLKKKIDT